MKLVLASTSPRRQALLANVGLTFTLRTNDTSEAVSPPQPAAVHVRILAERKALAVACAPGEVVIGADSVVALGDEILEKPTDAENAFAMLTKLSGNTHYVYTGVALRTCQKLESFTVKTKVVFYPLTSEDIRAYIATGEPMDKAGAYGIQGKGCLLVKEIQGDYSNAVGLPVAELMQRLKMI